MLLEIVCEAEDAVIERINRVGADVDKTREPPDTMAGPGIVARAAVKEPSLPSFGLVPCDRSVSISFSSTMTFSCAPLNDDRRVVDDADVEFARRQDELVVRGVVATDRDGEIEIQSLFENPLLVQRICRGVVVAVQRVIDLVGQRERELAIRIDMENEDGAFGLAFVLRDRYAPDFVCAVQLVHDLFADRGDLRNAVGGEDRMSIRPGIGAERERAAYATVHDRREIAGDDVRCVVGRQIVGVIIRLVVVVFVAVAVASMLIRTSSCRI